MSAPCHQPAKWNGMNTVSGPTRSVTRAFTLIRAPVGLFTQTYSFCRMRVGRRLRVDLHEVVLHQLGEPRVGARLVAPALVLDQAAAR